jgi:Txe/YoeB family toxin of Txe-Axe toxin-antitoxin module
MLFIERSLQFLKIGGRLSFVVDISFFETAYLYCRKYLVENYTIESLIYNIQCFENVASGQLVLGVRNKVPNENAVIVVNQETGDQININQASWNTPNDEYKFRISHCGESDEIIEKITQKNDPTLKDLYPRKNLRTCVMLLDMEHKFTSLEPSEKVTSYPYYRGSTGLKYKYSRLNHLKFFNYDKNLQDRINDELKEELTLKGIKNKKRIGLGETLIYRNPKIYIRQSAKELIASYDEYPSSANNSLYVFSLRDNSTESISFLKYLCGLINSTIYTFFAQNRRIIRYNRGKQPQIKTSDLYQIFVPQDINIKKKITTLVDEIYKDPVNIEIYKNEIDATLYSYYSLTQNEISTVKKSIESFLQ